MKTTIKEVTLKGKKLRVTSETKTSKGRVIKATMNVDSQARNHVWIKTEANKFWKETRIHFGSIDELRTFRDMINDLEAEYERFKTEIGK